MPSRSKNRNFGVTKKESLQAALVQPMRTNGHRGKVLRTIVQQRQDRQRCLRWASILEALSQKYHEEVLIVIMD